MMSRTYPVHARLSGLSGTPVSQQGVSTSDGSIIWKDAQGKFVNSDGSFFTGTIRFDSTGLLGTIVNGSQTFAGIGAAVGTGGNPPVTHQKCCNCTDTPQNETWYLSETRRTPQDIAVRVIKRKTVCNDPNYQVQLDCVGIQNRAAGLQGLGALNCNAFDNRM